MAATQIFLSLLLASLTLSGWAAASEEEENTAGQDIDLGQMFQMGLAMGKQYLGEAGVEKLKKGDFSELIELGEKFLGEGGVNTLVSAAAKEFLNVEDKDWQTGADSDEDKVRLDFSQSQFLQLKIFFSRREETVMRNCQTNCNNISTNNIGNYIYRDSSKITDILLLTNQVR